MKELRLARMVFDTSRAVLGSRGFQRDSLSCIDACMCSRGQHSVTNGGLALLIRGAVLEAPAR
jgi:hypothetical protein